MRIKKLKIRKFGTIAFLMALAIFVILGCEKEEHPYITPMNDIIIGYWEWYLTIEPYPYKVKTPVTEGYEAAIEFQSTDSVKYFKNAALTNTYPYEFKFRKNDHLNPNSDSTLVLKIDNGTETFFSILNDTLILDQTYVDGPRTHYKRKK